MQQLPPPERQYLALPRRGNLTGCPRRRHFRTGRGGDCAGWHGRASKFVCDCPSALLVCRTRDVPAPFRCARRGRETRFVRLIDSAGAIVVVHRPGGPGGRPGRARHAIGLVEAGAGAERPRSDPGARREPRAGGRRVQPRQREARPDQERPAGEQARAPARAPESDAFPGDALPAPRPDVHLRRREHRARGAARRELDRRADLPDRHDEPRLGPEHRGPEAGEDLPDGGQGAASASQEGERRAGEARRRAFGPEGVDRGPARRAATAAVVDQERDRPDPGGRAGATGRARRTGSGAARDGRRHRPGRERRCRRQSARLIRAAALEVRRSRRHRDAVPGHPVRLRRGEPGGLRLLGLRHVCLRAGRHLAAAQRGRAVRVRDARLARPAPAG